MEFTISTAIYLIAGVVVLGISILLYMYFNGGIDINIESLLGIIRRP